jgi:MFS family permease
MIKKFIYKKFPFPVLVWFMIVKSALARGAFFLVMPFVAIKMSSIPGMTATEIGLVLGMGPLVGTFAGFYLGHISDKIGRKPILFYALILWAISFLGFAFSETAFFYALCMAGNGIARAGFEPAASASISDLCRLEDNSGKLQKRSGGSFAWILSSINVP